VLLPPLSGGKEHTASEFRRQLATAIRRRQSQGQEKKGQAAKRPGLLVKAIRRRTTDGYFE
jgi:hypothetical protein